MGLHDELRDKRYMLIEDKVGATHYVIVGNQQIKLRNLGKLKDGDTVRLSYKQFNDSQNNLRSYLNAENLSRKKQFKLKR